ncbi:alpha/beta hydrolase [Parasphingopyxis algicola]|uniref:alpha/beta hydrolase n=1 Tax=Parasphingopyxis algicola TaxID=2026624 RepID=UPI0015A387DD|nr:alpha/beta hydrolase [Parasphingopyxis algicola]QLC24739.1 alpha/beta hydrolase [Parasphingopyxis algicola]
MNAEIEQLKTMIAAGMPEAPPTLEQRREGMEEMARAFPAPAGVAYEETRIAGVPVLEARAEGAAADGPLILYFHGGGYVSGSVRTHRNFAGELALRTGLKLVSVDYRLAPEHPYPAALDDARAVHGALAGDTPLVLAGDSAGGGLALSLALTVKATGGAQPERLALLCPWVDLSCTNASFAEVSKHDPIIDQQRLAEDGRHYLGDSDARDPGPSPLFGDLAGLPPLLVQTAEHDSLVGEAREFAAKAEGAGVAVAYREYPEMVHVFQLFHTLLTPGRAALGEAAEFLKNG